MRKTTPVNDTIISPFMYDIVQFKCKKNYRGGVCSYFCNVTKSFELIDRDCNCAKGKDILRKVQTLAQRPKDLLCFAERAKHRTIPWSNNLCILGCKICSKFGIFNFIFEVNEVILSKACP